ncbi:haloacid dehalogenase [Psychromonas sp. B3M02]|uniref:HAD family hydrolase n=1 Tax=Psychromonas sp. B3M02 TaxID=2267226 RepID=UPI000DEA1036|nr:HAD-IA family hydrolase [Psychromonas sp. B3M02]RBW45037.1 haloacid dehalogenase [Psychromonas sp. B3M02]
MKYQLIIFDWDGTLMDSLDKIVLCMQQATKQIDIAVPSEAAIKDIIGLSLLTATQQLFPDLPFIKQQQLVDAYRDRYHANQHIETPFYDGIADMLVNIQQRGYQLAVATGKGRVGLDRMIAKTNTAHLFSGTVCADEAHSKPDPLMIKMLLDKLAIPAEQALMIGDSIYDLEMAANAGIDSLGVSYGVHNSTQLMQAKPKAILDCLATELDSYI